MRQYFAIGILALLGTGCGGKSSDKGGGLGGRFISERTCVVTDAVDRTGTKPPAIWGMGKSGSLTIDVSVAADGASARVADGQGCEFVGTVQNGKVTAKDVDCEPLPADSILAVSGAASRRLLEFELDIRDKTHRQLNLNFMSTIDPSKPDVPQQSFSVCEGRLDGGALPSGVFLLKYHGETLQSVAQPLEVELAAEPGCDMMIGHSSTDGTLLAKFGANRNELTIYEEGVGCTVTAKSVDGIVFKADGSDCLLAKVGITQLGVRSRHFDKYEIDFGAKTWKYSSSHVQDRAPDGLRNECLQVTAQFTGELPLK